jgi:hypothetical protein
MFRVLIVVFCCDCVAALGLGSGERLVPLIVSSRVMRAVIFGASGIRERPADGAAMSLASRVVPTHDQRVSRNLESDVSRKYGSMVALSDENCSTSCWATELSILPSAWDVTVVF